MFITNDNIDISNYKEDIGINVWDFDLDDHEFSDGVSNNIQFPSLYSVPWTSVSKVRYTL